LLDLFFEIDLVSLLTGYGLETFVKRVQILGTGCAKCAKLAAATEQAAKTLGLEYQMEKVTDLQEIMCFGVMMTPALVVDGKVKTAGRVPSVEDLKKMLA
jgi:small redox-active disulfide protein 2